MLISELKIGLGVAFSTYGTVGTIKTFQGTVASIISGRYLSPNAEGDINHANIYPTLPDDIKALYGDDYTSYDYIQLVTAEGATYFIGLPWIVSSTLQQVIARTATIVLADFTELTPTRLRDLLTQNGYVVNSIAISE